MKSPVVRTYVVQERRVEKRYSRPVKIPKYQNVGISEEDNTVAHYSKVKTYPTAKTYSMRSIPARIPKPTAKTVEYKKNQSFNKRMISGKRYYLAYKSTSESPNLLVKVSFGNHKVVYQPMMGDMNMRDAKYLVEDGKLYMFADSFSQEGAYSKIDGYKKDYILVSSWSNGKKLNTLRYYYRLNSARSYLGVKGSSDPLAKALEDSEIKGVYLPNY
ncbi:hypothetical protein GSY74_06555 [Sulfurovum sp. bin170]|uniref:hypothetical protein n=1 Tax=Sulfurovum sp. bin170 TaxID=2695268 RepID=UPI0013DF9C9C|nr:hypothetical protein [Sulfurovum sp. bin170]NEW60941.1 hypothetical protein [Sulfurovum sp. bin170]